MNVQLPEYLQDALPLNMLVLFNWSIKGYCHDMTDVLLFTISWYLFGSAQVHQVS